MHKVIKLFVVSIAIGSLLALLFMGFHIRDSLAFLVLMGMISLPLFLLLLTMQWLFSGKKIWGVYIFLCLFQLLLVVGAFVCTGGFDSGTNCSAGFLSPILEWVMDIFGLTSFFGGPIFYLAVIIGLPVTDIIRQYSHYRTAPTQSRFFTQPQVWIPIGVLLFQVISTILFMKEAFSQTMRSEDAVYRESQQINMMPSTTYTAPEPLSVAWIDQVESRFVDRSDRDAVVNNVLVLNDVAERFWERNGRLAVNAADFTNLVPALHPRYKNDSEKQNQIGWIYNILYRKLDMQTYELCISKESETPPQELTSLGAWEFKSPYYCLQRTIK